MCLDPTPDRQDVELCSYSSEVAEQMQEAWDIAKSSIGRAQAKQKRYYDRNTKPLAIVRDRESLFTCPVPNKGRCINLQDLFMDLFVLWMSMILVYLFVQLTVQTVK